MFSVQKKKSSFRGAEFPWKRRRRSFPFSLVKERVDLPCQVKDFVLDRHFSACERLDRTEAWGWDPGNMHSVICCLFPVPPNSFHASVLPTMLIVEVCYRTKQHGWTEAMSLDWKDVKMVCAMGRVPWRSHVASLISATVSRICPLTDSLSSWVGCALFHCSVFHCYLSWLHTYSSLLSMVVRVLRNRLISDISVISECVENWNSIA